MDTILFLFFCTIIVIAIFLFIPSHTKKQDIHVKYSHTPNRHHHYSTMNEYRKLRLWLDRERNQIYNKNYNTTQIIQLQS